MRHVNFQYSLESVLDYRKKIEDTKKEKFVHRNNELSDENSVLEGMQQNYDHAIQDFKENGQASIQDQKNHMQYIMNLQKKMEKQKVRVHDCKKRCDLARVELTQAQKERKIMESLEEKELNRFMAEMKRKEQKELDEVAVMSHTRKKK